MTHPTTGKEMEFVAPLFKDMQAYIDKEFKEGEVHEKINPNIINSYFTTITNRV